MLKRNDSYCDVVFSSVSVKASVMPRVRRSNIGRRSRSARGMSNARANENAEQHSERNESNRRRMSQARSIMSQEERDAQN